jgi:hypothetical protein
MSDSKENIELHDCKCENWRSGSKVGTSETIYALGVIGAAVYFLQQATSLGTGIVGLIKAIGWPAVLVYTVLERLGL